MITRKSQREIDGMAKSGQLLASIHKELRTYIKEGMTTNQINAFVQKRIEEQGGTAAQIGYNGYEFATCISVNDELCHGFPSNYRLKNSDLVKVDFCVNLHGFLSDSCWAYVVGDGSPEVKQLMDVTLRALELGIEQAHIGKKTGDIGHVMDEYIKQFGYQMSVEFSGHGLGPTIHEPPTVPFVGEPNTGTTLREGMVITIEPIVNVSTAFGKLDPNGWTARTIDGSLSCQYEHTLAITADGPRILTSQDE